MGKKPYRLIIWVSVSMAIAIYLLNIYFFDSKSLAFSWKRRMMDFAEYFILYSALFFLVFSGIYWSINKIKAIVKKLP
jgi:hypothetical protein